MCSNLILTQIDAMCSHLPVPSGGKFSPSIVLMESIAASSVNDVPLGLGKWRLNGNEGRGTRERN